jgi:hypothetical protein
LPVPNGTSPPGVGLASTLFAVALLASGQNSTLTGTLGGQIVMEGFLHFRMQPWLRRLITRLIAVVPAVAVIGYYWESRTTDLLVIDRKLLFSRTARRVSFFAQRRDFQHGASLFMSGEWVNRPKPKAPGTAPADIAGPGQQQKKLQLMFDMIYLALVTDSTRAITIKTFGDHHDLSHHGKEPKKLEACRQVEVDLLKTYAGLLTKLKAAQEGSGGHMLDRTMVLITSNLKDGNSHSTANLPVLLAGGGFKHGQHLTFNQPYIESIAAAVKEPDAKTPAPVVGAGSTPLCNLYLSMLQRAGIASDRFSSSSGTLTGLELA